MPKILIINSHISWGGLAQYTVSLAKCLGKNDYDVYGLITHSDNGRYNDFLECIQELKYVGNKPKITKYIEIIRYVWGLKPDYLLINYNATIHFVLPFLPKCKIISVIHNDVPDFYRIAKINYRYVDAWVAPTPRIKQGFIEYLAGVNVADRVHTIFHGVNKSNFPLKIFNRSTYNLVFVGALYTHKGTELLPEIFSRFYQACPDSHLTIIGGGEEENTLWNKFEQKGLTEAVTFTGIIPSVEVRKKLQAMDVMVFPTKVEAFGLVLVEAMMEGVVPVSTLLSGITDTIVTDGITGFLISKNDIDGFVNCLKDLYDDRSKLLSISKNAKYEALEKFTDEHMAKAYVSLFLNLQKVNKK